MIMQRRITSILTALFLLLAIPSAAAAKSSSQPKVDIAIALDVSDSMSGLIQSAKQRLWDIVNELGDASPTPMLRVAVITYGHTSYDTNKGYVKVDQPFTSDLDQVNKVLFSFTTSGGTEFVSRAVSTATNELEWSDDSSLRLIFVAGNEPADQDPLISIKQAASGAAERGIVTNTIYCGSESSAEAAGWREVASLTDGSFASIDQNAAMVAAIATPMDDELLKLNSELNATYIAYGVKREEYKANQEEQDENAGSMSTQAWPVE